MALPHLPSHVSASNVDAPGFLTAASFEKRHNGRPCFCIGTAPGLSELNLTLLKDQLTLGCNQLTHPSSGVPLSFTCFHRQSRFDEVRESLLSPASAAIVVLPEEIATREASWLADHHLTSRVLTLRNRQAAAGHGEFFSFDLSTFIYGINVTAIQIQLAVWMGCNPIYLIGVDGTSSTSEPFYFDQTKTPTDPKTYQEYLFPELKEWIARARTLLWARGIKLLNAGGETSKLDVLPKTRLECAVGQPKIAVTSKTFSQDPYLTHEVHRHFRHVKFNEAKDALSGDRLVEFLRDADGAILGTEPLTGEVMDKLPCLRAISKYGVGLNNVDFNSALRHQIEVSYTKGVNSDSVAELTLAFTLMLLRRVDESVSSYRAGRWAKLPGRELGEISFGIIGYGHIGKAVARKLAALGIGRLLVHDILDFPVTRPIEFVSKEFLLAESDLVSLHLSADRSTHHFADESFFSAMKPGALFVNTARGELVDTAALITALSSGKVSGAALDVYEDEPHIDPQLLKCPGLITTCHIAGSSNRAIKNMGWAAIEGLAKLMNVRGEL